MPIDVGPIRAAEFPVTGNHLYFNHAGVSPIPARAAAAGIRMLESSRDEGAFHLRKWEDLASETRGRFARIVGASPEEIAFVKNTSEGLSFVAAGFPWRDGDNLVTSNIEYPSNVYPWMRRSPGRSHRHRRRAVAHLRRPGRGEGVAEHGDIRGHGNPDGQSG